MVRLSFQSSLSIYTSHPRAFLLSWGLGGWSVVPHSYTTIRACTVDVIATHVPRCVCPFLFLLASAMTFTW